MKKPIYNDEKSPTKKGTEMILCNEKFFKKEKNSMKKYEIGDIFFFYIFIPAVAILALGACSHIIKKTVTLIRNNFLYEEQAAKMKNENFKIILVHEDEVIKDEKGNITHISKRDKRRTRDENGAVIFFVKNTEKVLDVFAREKQCEGKPIIIEKIQFKDVRDEEKILIGGSCSK